MADYAAIVLAGGAGRRLGGVAKPLLQVGGRSMLDRVLDAVADANPRVVVGPDSLVVPPGVRRVSEQPPGGGPVAALAAGLTAVDEAARLSTVDEAARLSAAGAASKLSTVDDVGPGAVAVLAADLPFLTPQAIAELYRQSTVDCAVYVDTEGRRQLLCGVWRTAALRRRLAQIPRHHGAALRDLLAGLDVAEVVHQTGGPPPWYDCDSPEELDRAERWR